MRLIVKLSTGIFLIALGGCEYLSSGTSSIGPGPHQIAAASNQNIDLLDPSEPIEEIERVVEALDEAETIIRYSDDAEIVLQSVSEAESIIGFSAEPEDLEIPPGN